MRTTARERLRFSGACVFTHGQDGHVYRKLARDLRDALRLLHRARWHIDCAGAHSDYNVNGKYVEYGNDWVEKIDAFLRKPKARKGG